MQQTSTCRSGQPKKATGHAANQRRRNESAKRILLSLFCLLLLFQAFPQVTAVATWIEGDKVPGVPGIYGTKGVTNAANKPGGRKDALLWKDAAGIIWLFGGYGRANNLGGDLNDLWRYDPGSGLWTWISGDTVVNATGIYGLKGAASAAYKPGARFYSVGWMDAKGGLWLMGGQHATGAGTFAYNDLWRFDTTAKIWTWMSGDTIPDPNGRYGTQGVADTSNKPAGRYGAVSWTDAYGRFWLMGGSKTSGWLNDLWRFDTASRAWTWISGDSTLNQKGVYGTKGVAAATNKPGARADAVNWTDANGSFWMFGGFNANGLLNDLWRFDTATRTWTWVSGDSTTSSSLGVYGTKGFAAATNKPGARNGATGWVDATGKLWMMGGHGNGANNSGRLNDLWMFNPSTNTWTWVSGHNTANGTYDYGVQGVAAATNEPPARYGAVSWVDAAGKLWLMGGDALTSPEAGESNDMWRYEISDAGDSDADGDPDATDCAPTNPAIHHGATDIPDNGIDENCDGTDAKTWYEDKDGDGFGNPADKDTANTQPAGFVADSTDCDDGNKDKWRTATLYTDSDNDSYTVGSGQEICYGAAIPVGYKSTKSTTDDCDDNNADKWRSATLYLDSDNDGFTVGTGEVVCYGAAVPPGYKNTKSTTDDCNDSDNTIYPGAPELADGKDNNCNGQVDESATTWYQDKDGDGFGNPKMLVNSPTQPVGYVANNLDCYDNRLSYEDKDNDGWGVNNLVPCGWISRTGDCDDGDRRISSPRTWYRDADGDKFGDPANTQVVCKADPPTGFTSNNTDCDDANPLLNLGKTYYRDADGDGFGNTANPTTVCSTKPPAGYVSNKLDCDDSKPTYADKDGDGYGAGAKAACGTAATNSDCNDADKTIYPGAPEVLDSKDNNCNGTIDEGIVTTTWYRDRDGDGFGDPKNIMGSTTKPVGYVENNLDCDDNNLSYEDKDNDGWGINIMIPCGWIRRTGDCNDNDRRISSPRTWYRDADGDKFGDPANTLVVCQADPPAGYTSNNTDADDDNALVRICPPGWTKKANVDVLGRYNGTGFSIGNKGYLGIGARNVDEWIYDFWEYNPATNMWSPKGPTSNITISAVGFSIGGKGYLVTGRDQGSVTKHFAMYDTLTGTWSPKPDFDGDPRVYAVGFSIGNKGYIGTGNNDNGMLKDFWEYDSATDKWTRRKTFPGDARTYAVGFSIGNKGYIGLGSDDNVNHYTDFYEFDPAIGDSGTWTKKAHFPGGPRIHAVAFSIGKKGYVGTGNVPQGASMDDFWEFDPAIGDSGIWIKKADFCGLPRSYAVGFSIGNKGYIGTGGSATKNLNDFWMYDPSANPTVVTAPLPSLTVEQTGRQPEEKGAASKFTLNVYPNPFGKSTSLVYSVPSEARVCIRIYDLLGREVDVVVNSERMKGRYTAGYNTGKLAPGTYYCRLTAIADGNVFTHTIKLVKTN